MDVSRLRDARITSCTEIFYADHISQAVFAAVAVDRTKNQRPARQLYASSVADWTAASRLKFEKGGFVLALHDDIEMIERRIAARLAAGQERPANLRIRDRRQQRVGRVRRL